MAVQIEANKTSLKGRIIRTSGLSVHRPLVSLRRRPPTYTKWTEAHIKGAIDSVQAGESMRKAAFTYGIPKSTFYDRMTGKVAGDKPGPAPYLNADEEDELVSFLEGCASMGYARSKKQVLELVQSVISSKGMNRTVGEGWWKSFMKRHGSLSLRTAESLSYVRAVCSQPEVLNHYYDLLEKTLVDHELEGSPNQIFNLDESGMALNPCSPKVVVAKGTKHSTSIASGDKSQITVLACCSAAGYAIPPMIVLDRKTLRPEYAYGEVPGTMYALSSNGWMDTELFEEWFRHHFLIHAPSSRPLLLIMDGHSTHLQPSIIRMAAREDVILFCLPPHSTHLTQPLDKGCFGPLKATWKEVCHEFMACNPGRVITRYNFSELFGKAWSRSMNMVNITAGFQTTGIFPLNRNALTPLATLTPSKFNPEALVKGTKLKFLPVYSPSRSNLAPITTDFSEKETALFTHRYEEGYNLTDDKRYNQWLQLKAAEIGTANVDGKHTNGSDTGDIEECSVVKLSPPKDTSQEAELNAIEVQTMPKHLEKVDLTSNSKSQNDDAVRKVTQNPVLLKRSSALSKVLSVQHKDVKIVAKQPKTSARILTSNENLRMLEEKEKKKMEEAEKKRQRKEEAEKKKTEEAEKKRQRKEEAEKKRQRKEEAEKRKMEEAKRKSQHQDEIKKNRKDVEKTKSDTEKKKVNQEKSSETQLWCVCRDEEHGRMIFCEGKNCKIGWFHFKCVRLTRKPSGPWICDDCCSKP